MADYGFPDDREFGDIFMPEVMAILGRILFTSKYQTEDLEHNTDLMLISMAGKRVCVRVRRHRYMLMYDRSLGCMLTDEFTIRYSKGSGHKTEFEKMLIDGFGDYFFYGFADENEDHLEKWTLLDYNAIRRFCIRSIWETGREEFVKKRIHQNTVNRDKFIVFAINEIDDVVIADSEHWSKITV